MCSLTHDKITHWLAVTVVKSRIDGGLSEVMTRGNVPTTLTLKRWAVLSSDDSLAHIDLIDWHTLWVNNQYYGKMVRLCVLDHYGTVMPIWLRDTSIFHKRVLFTKHIIHYGFSTLLWLVSTKWGPCSQFFPFNFLLFFINITITILNFSFSKQWIYTYFKIIKR